MARSTPSTRPREIAYLEDDMRIPDLWRQFELANDELMGLLNRKSNVLAAVDNATVKVDESDRDLRLKAMTDESYATLSVAAQERLVKELILKDETHNEKVGRLRDLKAELVQVDTDIEAARINHRTLNTRIRSASEVIGFIRAAREARTAAELQLPY